MKYRQLGRSGLRVSTLCLGTMNFGPRTSEADSFEILDEAVNAGSNFIDTADQYGGSLGVGTTETILGNWLRQEPSRRHNLVLATKVHEPMSADVNDRGLSARHITNACEASLSRLGVEHIDLYQMHHIDRSVPVDEIWLAMDRLITQGKITYLGSSNFPGWAIAQANERAAAHRIGHLVVHQGRQLFLAGVGVLSYGPPLVGRKSVTPFSTALNLAISACNLAINDQSLDGAISRSRFA